MICDRFLRQDGQISTIRPPGDSRQNPWLAEVFGNVMLVNGKAFPFLDVEPRAYRFRVLKRGQRAIPSSLALERAEASGKLARTRPVARRRR